MIDKDKFTKRFWLIIEEERKKQGISMSKLAKLTGVKRTTLVMRKKANSDLHFSEALTLIKTLDIPTFKFTVKAYNDCSIEVVK